MPSRSGAEETLAPPTEQQANAPVATAMDAKLMLATANGDVQQLKDLVNKQEQDSKVMVLVMANQQAAEKPHHQQGNMDPHLLALASSGSSEKLQALLNNREDDQASGSSGTNGRLPIRRASEDDTEANELILEGVTAEGDTALHVVAACGQGDNFLESARIIYGKVKHLLFMQNNNGDTPLHCAARAGKSKMVACLIDLALAEGEGTRVMKELLRKENKHKETALNEAVRVGNMDIVDLLMEKDSELASFPRDGSAASPMYLAIMLKQDEIVKTLYDKSNHAMLSFSGPNGQNALHAAVLRHRDLTKLLIKWNKTHLRPQNRDLTTQRDKKGSTPLHFAAATKKPSSICQQVLEANPDVLYQPDHAGFFPIHVAASVGASSNVDMFVKKCPGCAGLRDGKGRTFLHVAVEKKVVGVVGNACSNLSLSWIMNMVDNDGNTALHLAVKAGSLQLFCPLLGNPQVNLNLPNNKGETPLDMADDRFPQGMFYNLNSDAQICHTLRIAGAVNGVRRWDHLLLEDNKTVKVKRDDSKEELKVLKDTTATLGIGSVLITTVTFGATFAVPGGYIADDHSNGGSPILARRYAFDAFIASNTLAFIFSTMATMGLMFAGIPLVNPHSREIHLITASYLISISLTSLAAAFGNDAYVVLAPVSYNTAVAIYVLSLLVPLYPDDVEFICRLRLLLPPLCTRKGPYRALGYSVIWVMINLLLYYWPLFVILVWASYANQAQKIQAHAPAPAPAPLA